MSCENTNCPFNNGGNCSAASTISTEISYQQRPKLFGIFAGISIPEAKSGQAKRVLKRMEVIKRENCRPNDYPLKNAIAKLKKAM